MTGVQQGRLQGYVLHERVGEGGMGIVHRATAPDGRTVAVKLMHPHVASDTESRARFAREAGVLGRVTGPHVAEVLDADVAAETPYLVTRFVAGSSLYDIVRRSGPVHGGDLADLAGDLADALSSIHAAGIVHRDLKPSNVLVEGTAEGPVAVLVDFGIAQLVDETRLTRTGMVYGTPGYVAPEVLGGADPAPPADVHAWAATVMFAATGEQPFGSGQLEVVALRVLREQPDLTGCPAWLRPVLQRCFSKNPEVRPRAADLVTWLDTGKAPAMNGPAEPPNAGTRAGSSPTLVYPNAHPEPARPLGTARLPVDEAPAHAHPAQVPTPQHPPAQPGWVSGRSNDILREIARHRRARRLLGGSVVVALASLGAVLPMVAGTVAVAWSVIARAVERSDRSVEARRRRRGNAQPLRAVTAVAFGWHAVAAGLITGLTAPLVVGGAALVVVLGGMVLTASGIGLSLSPLLFAGGLLTILFAWRGPASPGLRAGSRRLLATPARNRLATTTIVVVLLVVTAVCVAAVLSGEVSWLPFDEWPVPPPLEFPDGLPPILPLDS